jgi:hypothetical protein
MAEQSEDIHFNAGCSPVCDVVRRPKRRKRRSRPLHRWLGMLAALPLVWVLVTGFLLNHSDDFGLNEKQVESPTVLAWYGMVPEGQAMLSRVGGEELVCWDGVVFLNRNVVEVIGQPLGVGKHGSQTAVVSAESVSLFDDQGELVESLDELSLPSLPILATSQVGDSVVLKNAEGWWQADEDWLEFELLDSVGTIAGMTECSDPEVLENLRVAWSGGGIPMDRFILDLHAGHFLGDFAKYFYDVVVVATLWLIITGLVLQYRTTRRSRNPRPGV